MITLEKLTDEIIKSYSEDRVLSDSRDLIQKGNPPYPKLHPGSVYDPMIHGSLYVGTCMCKRVRVVGARCIECGTKVLSEEEMWQMYGRIEMPLFYLNEMSYKYFVTWFLEFLNSNKVNFNLDSTETRLSHFVFDTHGFHYDAQNNTIFISDIPRDESEISYEGILSMFKEHFKDGVDQLTSFINRTVLTIPPVARMFTFGYIDGKRHPEIHPISAMYQTLIYLSNHYIPKVEGKEDNLEELAMSRALVRKFVNVVMVRTSEVLRSSKANLMRQMYSQRATKSGRAVIVADPTIKIDEVSLPQHLLYETFSDDFIKYLMDTREMKKKDAVLIRNEASEETLTEFDAWVQTKSVLINRNPSLHEYNVLCCKVVVNKNYTLGLPIQLCSAFNADFDGDEMSFYAIPDDLAEGMIETMSPKNLFIFKNNLNPLFIPTHETLNGLYIASKVTVVVGGTMEEIDTIDFTDDIDENTQVIYKGKITTKNRAFISEILQQDLDLILGSNPKCKVPELEIITTKNINDIIMSLNLNPERVDIIKKLQDFALEVVTLEGVTTLSIEDIYDDMPEKQLGKLKEIMADESLSEHEKMLQIEREYGEYLKRLQDNLDPTIRTTIDSSGRVKMASLLAMMAPQIYISKDGQLHMTKTSQLKGYDFEDYVEHAVENRSIQDIKKTSVPTAGYLARQTVFTAYEYVFDLNLIDEENSGISIKMKDAVGRTLLDGTKIGPNESEEVVKVRSVITSTKTNLITADMINNDELRYRDKANIGVSLATSLSKDLTQRGLALKHGGSLFSLDENSILYAKDNCMVTLDDNWIYVKYKGKLETFPKPEDFVLGNPKSDKRKKGEVIGCAYKINNAAYKLDSMIRMLGASGSMKHKEHERNTINLTTCYSPVSGVIKYDINPKGDLVATIGSTSFIIDRSLTCHFAEGSKVNVGDRITSGILNLSELFKYTNNVDEAYGIFRNQFKELHPGVIDEMMEFMFKVITEYDGTKLKYLGVSRKGNSTEDLFVSLSFERARKKLEGVFDFESPKEFKESSFSSHLITLLLNNKINKL